MRIACPSSRLRHLGAIGGIPLLALALGFGEPAACQVERGTACGTSTSVQRTAGRPRPANPGRKHARPGSGSLEKRSGQDGAPPRPTVGEPRRGGVGTLIGITFA